MCASGRRRSANFYSRPCGRGDSEYSDLRCSCCNFYSRPCGRGDLQSERTPLLSYNFYSRPCGRGDAERAAVAEAIAEFLLTPLREGRLKGGVVMSPINFISTHAPAGGASLYALLQSGGALYFYSRPCGRGDYSGINGLLRGHIFLLTPLREGRRTSRPVRQKPDRFLLTPLREGRQVLVRVKIHTNHISTHAPAGGATCFPATGEFELLTISTHAPAGGATRARRSLLLRLMHFYSRPCGRGDVPPRMGL